MTSSCRWTLGVIATLTILIFAVDLSLPLGVAGGVPYVLVVVLTFRLPRLWPTTAIAVMSSALVLTGYIMSPDGGVLWMVITNRSLALLVIWVGSALVIRGKRDEYATRKREELYRDVIEGTDDLVTRVDADGRFTFVNSKSKDIFGLSPSSCIGLSAFDFVHPDDREATRDAFAGWTRHKLKYVTYENRQVSRSGQVRYLLWTINLHQDESGRVTHVSSIARDITDHKRSEAQERVQASIMRKVAEGILLIGTDDLVIKWTNERSDELFGYGPGELVGKMADVIEAPTEATPAEARSSIVELLQETGEWCGEVRNMKGDGTPFWCYAKVSLVDHPDFGEVMVSVHTDITERKDAEVERLRLERQVQQGQKLESLGAMAGGIAHDFNNLLMAILGNVDLALCELPPHTPGRDKLREIEKASRRAAELANQMLAYSGKGQFVIEPIDLSESIAELAHLLEASISKKAVLERNIDDDLPTFDGDRSQISRIIVSLIANASESLGDRSGVITLSAGATHCDRAYLDSLSGAVVGVDDEAPREGRYVYVEVADTGCGMDAATTERIFDPFFTTKFMGRGLGLSAALGIMRGHNGAIKIQSEVGKGTTLRLLFPANEPPADGSVLAGKNGKDVTTAWQGRGTVLIVDDEAAVRTVGKRMLERLDFTALTAPDGKEAVDVFREHRDEIVCVLLDLTMPGMDGEATLQELLRIRTDATVVLCSGYNINVADERFASRGLAGFLQKPYGMASLKEKLAQVLA